MPDLQSRQRAAKKKPDPNNLYRPKKHRVAVLIVGCYRLGTLLQALLNPAARARVGVQAGVQERACLATRTKVPRLHLQDVVFSPSS